MEPIRASVVIPCFNYGHYLAEAVESVCSQTLHEHEVIIVDDGSTDDSRVVAHRLIQSHPESPIALIAQDNSGSPGIARNAGVTAARGDYVVCLDADDLLDRDYLQLCAQALDAHPEAAIAYSDFHLFGNEDRVQQPPPWNTRNELDCNFLGVAAMFRREAWTQVGGYDPEIGYEDWDFWVGLIERGWVGVKVAGALWHYRAHGTGVHSGHLTRDQEIKARIVLKHSCQYNEGQREWASGVLSGDPRALAAGTQPGAIPSVYAASQAPKPGLPVRAVCLITKDYPPKTPGGIPRAVGMQAVTLAKAGVEVHVITRSPSGAEAVREDRGVTIHEVPEPALAVPGELAYLEIPLWSWMAAVKFAQLDSVIGFDIVEAPDYRGEALHLRPRPETALIVWLHSTMMVHWNSEPGYVRTPSDDAWHALEMAAIERADLLLAPSQLLADTTAEFLGPRMRPVELMPYLFDSEDFPARSASPARRSGPIQVLFYGRLEGRKYPELALYAVACARAGGLDVQLTLLGRNNANYRERVLEPLQAKLGLNDVTYKPHVELDELRAILGRTDVAILASRFDNSPLTIFEALASGVPVITSDRVGTASWFDPEDGLLTLPVDDPAEFGRRAAEAIADPAFLASGERAAKLMRERFAPEMVTERLLDVYARLLASRRHPAATQIEGARGSAVLAFADELVADPSMLEAWGREFDATDDVTLVIAAPGWTAAELSERLVPAVAAAGLDGDDAADLLALAAIDGEQALAAGCQALYSTERRDGPYARLPAIDAAGLVVMREQLRIGASS